LRALDVETLMTTLPTDVNVAGTSVGYGPSVDGDLLKDNPLDLVRAKKHSAVPIVFGANSYETSRAVPATVTENNYETLVRAQFGPLADQILAEYPLSAYPTARRAMVRITSDAKFICPQRVYAKAAAENQEAPVFRYMFTQGLTQNAMLRPFGAFHGAELLFVFERFAAAGYTPSDDEAALADAMQAYWASAADGSFAPEGLTPWEPWDATDPYLLLEGGNVSIQRGWDTEKCDFWEPLITATF
jgi:para-nitrobenzyl esterase